MMRLPFGNILKKSGVKMMFGAGMAFTDGNL